MASQIFNVVNMRKGDQEKSFEWYRNQVKGLSRGVTGTQIIRSEKLSSRILPGQMYLFMYDPKHKETLPYYDMVPLVLPFRRLPDGFLGMNLHYIPYLSRYRLLQELMKLTLDKTVSENTRIQLSWSILNSSAKYLSGTACVKRYLNTQLRSRFLKINYSDWQTAAMLPVEQFRKAKKETVWRDTKQKYGYR
jgi:hypothetical protein